MRILVPIRIGIEFVGIAEMAESVGEDGYEEVCSLAALKAEGRKRVTVKERIIVLFYANEVVHALDHFCYHAGGPLSMGDIEDSHGRLCVVCPWHKHSITLDTGESLYTSINPSNPKEKKYNCSKGVKQRVHNVKIVNDTVYLKLSDLSQNLESDRYFSEQFKPFIEGVLQEPLIRKPPPRYPIHSFKRDFKK